MLLKNNKRENVRAKYLNTCFFRNRCHNDGGETSEVLNDAFTALQAAALNVMLPLVGEMMPPGMMPGGAQVREYTEYTKN